MGPRQYGKTTLVKQIMAKDYEYFTLEDVNQLQFAKLDPVGFIRNISARHVIIDEIQRLPELFLPIKQAIDENRVPGKYLLTGSANALTLPQVADSLAGRLEVVQLLPLAECEINDNHSTFLAKILSGKLPESKATRIRKKLIDKVLTGGFPEAPSRKEANRRATWFNQYILSIVQKDMQDLGQIEHLDVIPKLIQVICNHVGSLINYTEIGNKLGLSRQTITKYLKLLEQLFILQELPAWHLEVDVVIETLSGDVIGIEIKAPATLRKSDFQGLERLRIAAGKNFLMGIVLYDGDHSNVIDKNIVAAPIGSLWK